MRTVGIQAKRCPAAVCCGCPGHGAAQHSTAQRSSTQRRSLHGTGRLGHPLLCAPVRLGHVCLTTHAYQQPPTTTCRALNRHHCAHPLGLGTSSWLPRPSWARVAPPAMRIWACSACVKVTL